MEKRCFTICIYCAIFTTFCGSINCTGIFAHKSKSEENHNTTSGNVKKKKISNLEFLQRIDTVHYCISNVKYLFPSSTRRVFVEQFDTVMNKEIDNYLQHYQLSNFRKIENQFNQRLTIGFDVSARKNNGIVDTLPYASRELCLENHIRYLAMFYIYKTRDADEFLNDESELVNIPFQEFSGITGYVSPSVTVNVNDVSITNIQIGFALYNVEHQRLLFIDVGSDDEYDNAEEMVEELFGEMGLK
jgi:hypothetical protein